MELKIDKNSLLEKLSLASRFSSSRFSTLTQLQNILLKADNGEVNIYSTNLNSFFHTTLKTEDKVKFEIILEPKKAIEILNLLQAGKAIIDIQEKQIVIKQEKTKASLSLINYEEFPTPPQMKEKTQKIKAKFLLEEFPLVLFSSSQDETRPVLTGINFISQGEDVVMVSTDGFRLSLLKVKKTVDLPSLIIPGTFLSEIARLVKDENEIEFGFSQTEKMVYFKIGDNNLYSRLIEGEFPDFEKVIPADKKTTIVLDREEFLRNIKLSAVIARDFSNIVICDIQKKGVYIRPKTDVGDVSETFQEAEFEGDEQKIAFNFRFLIDFLNHINTDKVVMEVLRPDAPVVFKTQDKKDFLHIIMPIRIQQ